MSLDYQVSNLLIELIAVPGKTLLAAQLYLLLDRAKSKLRTRVAQLSAEEMTPGKQTRCFRHQATSAERLLPPVQQSIGGTPLYDKNNFEVITLSFRKNHLYNESSFLSTVFSS
jgi:hypothetical protein